jgi:hypothetical protein
MKEFKGGDYDLMNNVILEKSEEGMEKGSSLRSFRK